MIRFKHLQGKHNQQDHDPTKGRGKISSLNGTRTNIHISKLEEYRSKIDGLYIEFADLSTKWEASTDAEERKQIGRTAKAVQDNIVKLEQEQQTFINKTFLTDADDVNRRATRWFLEGTSLMSDEDVTMEKLKDVPSSYDELYYIKTYMKKRISEDLYSGLDSEDIAQYVDYWAASSNEGDSLAVQQMVTSLYNVELTPWQHKRFTEPEGAISSKYGQRVLDESFVEELTKRIYETTQESLMDYPVDDDGYITLYRSVNLGETPTQGIHKAKLNALESWTSSVDLALSWGGTDWKGNNPNTVLFIKVKPSRVFSTAKTGPGCLTESEFVLLGTPEGVYDEVVVLR